MLLPRPLQHIGDAQGAHNRPPDFPRHLLGYCTYTFFEQCPHRLACARCDFYVSKDSTRAQLLEAKANLQRMLLEIPLTESERAAVEDGIAAVEQLIEPAPFGWHSAPHRRR